MSNLRSLMESIDEIIDGNDEMSSDNSDDCCDVIDVVKDLSKELPIFVKGLVEELSNITQKVKNGEEVDESVVSNLSEMLSLMKEINSGNTDEMEDEIVEECDETEAMAPSFDADGTQNYSDPNGSSYPARKGFVGI